MTGDWKYRPAADLDLAAGERLRSVRREGGLVSLVARGLWWRAVRGFLCVAHRLRVDGLQHLPAEPPVILVANHSSHLDALVLAAALPPRMRRLACPLAAGDLFFQGPASSVFSAFLLNALPMWRKATARHALLDLRERLLRGDSVFLLFPEGTRSRTGELAPFKPGVGMLVAGTSIPVVPAHIVGAHAAWPPDRRFPRPRRVQVTLGAPSAFPDVPNDREGWNRIAAALEAEVRSLASPAP